MASFKFDGIDYLEAHFDQLTRISDDEKYSVLEPAANVLLQRQRDKFVSLFRQITGGVRDSLTVIRKSDDAGVYAHITFKGKHPKSKGGKRRAKGKGKTTGSNAEIAYILEYGSPRIPARHWLEEANEEAADEVISMEEEAWNQLLTEKGF